MTGPSTTGNGCPLRPPVRAISAYFESWVMPIEENIQSTGSWPRDAATGTRSWPESNQSSTCIRPCLPGEMYRPVFRSSNTCIR